MNGVDLICTVILVVGYVAVVYADVTVMLSHGSTLSEIRRFNRMVESSREIVKTTLRSLLFYGLLFGILVGAIFSIYFAAGTFIALTVVEYKLIKYKASLSIIDEAAFVPER